MTINEVAALLGWSREDVKRAIQVGVSPKGSDASVMLEASPRGVDFDITDAAVDASSIGPSCGTTTPNTWRCFAETATANARTAPSIPRASAGTRRHHIGRIYSPNPRLET